MSSNFSEQMDNAIRRKVDIEIGRRAARLANSIQEAMSAGGTHYARSVLKHAAEILEKGQFARLHYAIETAMMASPLRDKMIEETAKKTIRRVDEVLSLTEGGRLL